MNPEVVPLSSHQGLLPFLWKSGEEPAAGPAPVLRARSSLFSVYLICGFVQKKASSKGNARRSPTAPKPRIEAHLSSNLWQKADTLVARPSKDRRVFKVRPFEHWSAVDTRQKAQQPVPNRTRISLYERAC
jgi:hypothetical protein